MGARWRGKREKGRAHLVCNLVEHWRELGNERDCEDGVDEAALFFVFRPYRVV